MYPGNYRPNNQQQNYNQQPPPPQQQPYGMPYSANNSPFPMPYAQQPSPQYPQAPYSEQPQPQYPNQPQQQPHVMYDQHSYAYYNPQVQLSLCNGNKKSLLIGINYFGQQSELKGCINDVQNMRSFICSRWAFPSTPNNMVILTDDQRDLNYQPTRVNIINAIKWLVGGSKPGDSLLFHFSGHGGRVKDRDGDEVGGYDSCIYPVDHKRASHILDDELNVLMVRYLPAGVRLTAIFDCCHSGSGLDLPYLYNHDGSLKRFFPMREAFEDLKAAGGRGLLFNPVGTALRLAGSVMSSVGNSGAEERSKATKSTYADVVMFSGCKDSQTSADTFVGGVGATGAMSYALIKALTDQPHQTYLSLLSHVRAILSQKYSQKPQLSSGRPMDMNSYFIM